MNVYLPQRYFYIPILFAFEAVVGRRSQQVSKKRFLGGIPFSKALGIFRA